MSGWICSYRAIWDHPIFRGNAARVGVWDWLLKKAAWKPMQFIAGGETINLQRGQLCISQAQVTEETGMPRQQLRSFLTALEREGAIQTQPATKATKGRTLITVCNYGRYQLQEKPANQRATKEQPTKEQDNTYPSTSSLRSEVEAEPVPEHQPDTIEVDILSKAVWDVGKTYLASRGVKNAGAMIGRWLKDATPTQILEAIQTAQRSGTQDPVPYITEVLKGDIHVPSRKAATSSRPQNRPDPALEQIARLAGLGEAPGYGGS